MIVLRQRTAPFKNFYATGRLCSLTILFVCQNADIYFAQDDNSDTLATTALAA